MCVYVFFLFILDIKFVGRTSRGHTGGRSHRIFHPPSFCGARLLFSREKDSAIPFPRRPRSRILCTDDLIVLRMVINTTCFEIPGSGFIFAASEYPMHSMTNKVIIQYTNVLFTQSPIGVCLDGTNIDSRTILVTMYYCGQVRV